MRVCGKNAVTVEDSEEGHRKGSECVLTEEGLTDRQLIRSHYLGNKFSNHQNRSVKSFKLYELDMSKTLTVTQLCLRRFLPNKERTLTRNIG